MPAGLTLLGWSGILMFGAVVYTKINYHNETSGVWIFGSNSAIQMLRQIIVNNM